MFLSPGILSILHFTEQIVDRLAAALGVTSEQIKEANLYKEGQLSPFNVPLTPCYSTELWSTLKSSADFDKRAADIETFNKVACF